jgi:hypothetical protein
VIISDFVRVRRETLLDQNISATTKDNVDVKIRVRTSFGFVIDVILEGEDILPVQYSATLMIRKGDFNALLPENREFVDKFLEDADKLQDYAFLAFKEYTRHVDSVPGVKILQAEPESLTIGTLDKSASLVRKVV